MTTSFNFRKIRAGLALAALVAFAAASFLLTPQSAQMQSQTVTPRIVFDRDKQIRVVNADGTGDTLLAEGFDPVWSPDGTKIAYANGVEYNAEIYIMNADGSNQIQLTQNWHSSYSPTFSPDGTKIAYVSDHEGDYHIYTVNVDGTNQQRIDFAGDFIGAHAPTFSADGTKIVFVGTTLTETGSSRDEYYIANSDGSAPVRLTFTGGFNRYQAGISPDGSNILVSRWQDIYAVKTDGSGVTTNLTNSSPAETDADYSPDGTQIVFRRGANVGLMIMNADGTNQTALNVLGDNPDWLPTAVSPTPTPTITPTVTPTPTTDLNLQVSTSSQNVNVGNIVTFTVNVRNNGDAATNVKVFGTASINGLLNQVQYTSMNAPGGCTLVIGGSSVECQIGALAPNQTAVVTINVRPNVAGSLIFNLSASATEVDTNEADNSGSANVQVSPAPVCASNVTASLSLRRLPAIRNPYTGEYEQLIIARNTSNQHLDSRAMFVFDNLTSGVSVAPRSNPQTTQCAAPIGSQYVTVNAGGVTWRPNQTVVVRVTFTNPQRRNINYNLRVMNGTNNP